MPRANRHFVSGHVWHITHRCHKKEFLLKFARDRKRWLHWLFEAKKRYGLTILNYIVTSNHIHLLVLDNGRDEIAKSMQLIAGRTAQEYNQRKGRKGAYWEDRYHATAIDTHDYLIQCLVYIDMNMVRTGVVKTPEQWEQSGYNEIQNQSKRYTLIDRLKLFELCGLQSVSELQVSHKQWVEEAVSLNKLEREERWSASLAVGDQRFIEAIKKEMGMIAKFRKTLEEDGVYEIRDDVMPYSIHFSAKNSCIR